MCDRGRSGASITTRTFASSLIPFSRRRRRGRETFRTRAHWTTTRATQRRRSRLRAGRDSGDYRQSRTKVTGTAGYAASREAIGQDDCNAAVSGRRVPPTDSPRPRQRPASGRKGTRHTTQASGTVRLVPERRGLWAEFEIQPAALLKAVGSDGSGGRIWHFAGSARPCCLAAQCGSPILSRNAGQRGSDLRLASCGSDSSSGRPLSRCS